MKKKFLGFLILLMMVASPLFLSVAKNANSDLKVYADGINYESHWFVKDLEATNVDDKIFENEDLVGGYSSGYGKYLLGQTDVVNLTATANSNFCFAGWRIENLEQENNNVSFLTTNTSTYNVAGYNGVQISITYTYNIVNGYEYVSGSTITFNTVYANLQINPVFDFVYYRVEMKESDFNMLKMSRVNVNTNGYNFQINYFASSTELGVTTYSNTVLKIKDFQSKNHYYYFGELKKEGNVYYTIHKNDDETEIKVDVKKGAYRINEKVTASFNINISNDETLNGYINSYNIDIQNVYADINGFEVNAGFEKVCEGNLNESRTKQIKDIEFTIPANKGLIQNLTLNFDYHKLYIVNTTIKIDGDVVTEGDNYNLILSNIDYTNLFSSHNGILLAKNAKDNDGNIFNFSTNREIKKTITENVSENEVSKDYLYYNFSTLNGSYSLNFINIINFEEELNPGENVYELIVNYSSAMYSVKFQFASGESEEENYNLTLLSGDYNLPSSNNILKRNDSYEFGALKNSGYDFVGYYVCETNKLTSNPIIGSADIKTLVYDALEEKWLGGNATIDETKPENLTVILIYSEIKYNVTLNGYQAISLSNNQNVTIYPVNQVNYSINNENYIISNDNLNDDTSYQISQIIEINDVVNLGLILNNGFKVLGYKFQADSKLYAEAKGLSFTLDKNLIDTYLSTSLDLDITICLDYVTYTATYFTEKLKNTMVKDPISNENIVETRADIYFDLNGTEIKLEGLTNYVTLEIVETDNGVTYTLSGLRLYDKLKFISKAKQYTYKDEHEDSQTTNYIFNYYTSDNLTALNETKIDDQTYYYLNSNGISKDVYVKVVYSMNTTMLQISVDKGNAYTLNVNDLVIKQKEPDKDEVTIILTDIAPINNILEVVISSGAQITIEFKSSQANINNGYNFKGINGEIESPNSYQGSGFQYIIGSSSAGINNVVLNFLAKKFNVNIEQGFSTEGVNSVFNPATIEAINEELDVENSIINITAPTGYKIESVKLNNNTITEENLGEEDYLGEDNFIFNLKDSFEKSSTGASFNFTVTYTVKTYQIEISRSIYNTIQNDEIKYPTCDFIFTGSLISLKDEIIDTTTNKIKSSNLTSFITTTYPQGTKNLIYDNIPYGLTFKLKAKNNQSGMSIYGWTNVNGKKIFDSEYNISQISHDYCLYLSIQYDNYSFTIKMVDTNQNDLTKADATLTKNEENAIITNNGQASVSVILFDKLKVEALNYNSKANGWKVQRIYYKDTENTIIEISAFKEYFIKNSTSFEVNYLKLYTYDEKTSQFIKNTSSVRKPGVTYYEYDPSNAVLEINQFNPDNFYDNIIYVEFIPWEVNIVNINTPNTNLNVLEPENYTEFAATLGGTTVDLNSETISFDDFNKELKIYIKFSSVEIDGVNYNLNQGLQINTIEINGNVYPASKLLQKSTYLDYDYVLSLQLISIAKSMLERTNDIIEIVYNYKVLQFEIAMETNITDSSFYDGTFKYGFKWGNNTSTSNLGSKDHSSKRYFLTDLSCQVFNNYSADLIKIARYEFYVKNDSSYTLVDNVELNNISNDGTFLNIIVDRDYKIKLIIELKVTINNAYIETLDILGSSRSCLIISSAYLIDSNFNGIPQELSVGQLSSSDIQVAKLLENNLKIIYRKIENLEKVTPLNVGYYLAVFEYKNNTSWMQQLALPNNVCLKITPKKINIAVLTEAKFEKFYDGTSNFDAYELLKHIAVRADNGTISKLYTQSNFALDDSVLLANITYSFNGEQILTKNVGNGLNIKLSNLQLIDSIYNKNFDLINSEIIFSNIITINPAVLTVQGVEVYDKVDDGTNKIEINKNKSNLQLYGVINGDEVYCAMENVTAILKKGFKIGLNNEVLLDFANALYGEDVNNYTISTQNLTAAIYPYEVSSRNIKDIGVITLYNERGMVDPSLANLIPINAILEVSVIYLDDLNYTKLYPIISDLLTSKKVFAIGYKIVLKDGSVTKEIDKNLYLSVPSVDKFRGAIWVYGEKSENVYTTTSGNNIIIDLSESIYKVDTIVLTQQRQVLKLWQIILISIGAIAIVGTTVGLFVFFRMRKRKLYEVNDTI